MTRLGKDILGFQYERLTVIEKLSSNGRNISWKCICKCGKYKILSTSSFLGKRVKSCGCLVKELTGARNRLPEGISAKRRIFCSYKKGAKLRKLDFLITFEIFENIINKNCHYCGCSPSNSSKTINPHGASHILYNGIDRIDNNIGYILSNIVPCCKHCNFAKFDFSYDEFINYLDRVVKYRNTIC